MRTLAKVGFNQSYTYFTWKNSRWELTEYVDELACSREQEYFRPNFFANTPDILTEYLAARRPGRRSPAALVLAATLSPSYGIYSGFEHFENVPVRAGQRGVPGLREVRGQASARSTARCCRSIRRLNAIRRENPALQHLANITLPRRPPTTRSSPTPSARATTWSSRVVNLDPARRPGGRRHRAGRARPAAGLRRARPAHRRALRLAHRAATTSASTRRRAGPRPAWSRRDDPPQRPGALVRGQPAVVQDGGLLRDPPARLLRRQRRRLGRLPRPDREARLPAVARHRLHLAAADVRLAAARRRLRHRRLLHASTPTTGRSRTSARSSTRPTSAASASSPTSS